MRAVVAGGDGFIGSSVIDRLLLAGHTAVVYDKRTSSGDAEMPANPHFDHKKDRSAGMSNPHIDDWYERGRRAGAVGGERAGAGGGGLLLCCAEQHAPVRTAMKQAGPEDVRFRFDFEGTKVLFS